MCFHTCGISLLIITGLIVLSSPGVFKSYNQDGYYYYYNSTPVTWQEAVDICSQDYQGKLVTLSDPALQQELLEIADSDFWIGGRRENRTHWVWLETGREVDIDTPSDASSECAYVSVIVIGSMSIHRGATIKFDLPCTTELFYICDTTECKHGGYGRCLSIQQGSQVPPLGWLKAQDSCVSQGMNLSSLPPMLTRQAGSAPKYTVLTHFHNGPVPVGKYWIGLHHKGWRWNSGEKILFNDTFKSWTTENYAENCLLVEIHGSWRAANCLEEHPFICVTNFTRKLSIPTSVIKTPRSQVVDTSRNANDPANIVEVKGRTSMPQIKGVILWSIVAAIIGCVLLVLAGLCFRYRRKHGHRATNPPTTAYYGEPSVAYIHGEDSARVLNDNMANSALENKSIGKLHQEEHGAHALPYGAGIPPTVNDIGSIYVGVTVDTLPCGYDAETFENPLYYKVPAKIPASFQKGSSDSCREPPDLQKEPIGSQGEPQKESLDTCKELSDIEEDTFDLDKKPL